LNLKDAVDLYQTQVAITNDLWTFFGTVTLAVLGFTIGSEKATKSPWAIGTIVVGYLAFSLGGNLQALREAYWQLAQFNGIVKEAAAASAVSLNMDPYTVGAVTLFHVLIAIAVSVAILIYWWFAPKTST
jgi:hypothetical protein